MIKSAVIRSVVLVAGLAGGVAGCSSIERKHGYVPTESDLQEIAVGIDTRDTVTSLIGIPSTRSLVHEGNWYYVSSKWETKFFLEPQEVEREVIVVSFDSTDTVTNIERFGLEDGRVIALNRRVTDDNIQGVTFLRQLLGNIGNIDPGQFLGSN